MDQRSSNQPTNNQNGGNFMANNQQPINGDQLTSSFSGIKFLAVFTTSHLTISLLFIGLIVLLFGILGMVISKLLYITSDPEIGQAFQIIGITCICIAIVLIVTAIGIMILAIRWARRKIYCLPNPHQQSIQLKHHHHHYHYPNVPTTPSNQQSTVDLNFYNTIPTAPPLS